MLLKLVDVLGATVEARRRRSQARRGVLRVMGYMSALLFVVLACNVHTARAEMVDDTFAIGRDLLPLADVLTEPHRVNLNGEHAWIDVSATPLSVKEVLDRYETACHAGGVKDWNESLGIEAGKLDLDKMDLGLVRNEKDGEGVVLCFVKSPGAAGLLQRVKAFVASGDLGELGKVRYAFARATPHGSSVVTVWTDGRFDLNAVIGKRGGEPGSDDPDLPRPDASRRIVSAGIEGTEYWTRVYATHDAPLEATANYESAMLDRGWLRVNPQPQNPENTARGYLKEGHVVIVGAAERRSPDESGEVPKETLVSISELGGDSAAAIAKQVAASQVVEK